MSRFTHLLQQYPFHLQRELKEWKIVQPRLPDAITT